MKVYYNPLAKIGQVSSIDESGDFCSPESVQEIETHEFRASIADGSNGIKGSKLWARIVSESYCSNLLGDWQQLRDNWQNEMNGESNYQAFAAFVGISLKSGEKANRGTWHSQAMGDCCLFQVRDGVLINSFPLKVKSELNKTPTLVSSIKNFNDHWIQSMSNEWLAGDLFILSSDGLAGEIFDAFANKKVFPDLRDSGKILFEEFRKNSRAGKSADDLGYAYIVLLNR